MSDTLRAVLWVAVSSQDQADPDKASLPEQLRLCQEWCAANDCRVVATLRVDGFSRSESDVITALEDFAEQGVTAYKELRALWQSKGFDVLVAYNHSRLGRSSTLHSWVVENVILSGARIYLINGGWIDKTAFRFQIAMGGNASASEIDTLKDRYQFGMQKRARMGLPKQDAPLSHVAIRNALGKVVRLELNPATARIFEDLKNLVIAGKPWGEVSRVMYYELGHINPQTGKAFKHGTFYRWLHSPMIWGFSAIGFTDKYGLWAFDDSAPVPDGVTVHRSPEIPIPPVYTGRDAELLKAELRRRHDIIQGTAKPDTTHMFAGLLKCVCGRRMTYHNKGAGIAYYRCNGKYKPIREERCKVQKMIREDLAREQINKVLKRWLATDRPDLLPTSDESRQSAITEQITAIQQEIASLTSELAALMTAQRKASVDVQDDYQQQINDLGERRKILRTRLDQLRTETQPASVVQARVVAYETLAAMKLEAFWRQPSRKINQMLHAALGGAKFIVEHGEIVDCR